MNGKGRARHSVRAATANRRVRMVPERRAWSDAPYLAKRRIEFIGFLPPRSGASILTSASAVLKEFHLPTMD
jgi:hypothetical protein